MTLQCSSCSNVVKPVVACDIDGTLAEYHGHLAQMCYRYWNIEPQNLFPWDGAGEFEDYLGLTKAQYREAKLAFRQGGFKRWMPVRDGAKRFANAVRQQGAELWLATTRPWQRLDNVDPDTRWWLEINNIPYDALLFGDDKYERLLEAVDKERIVFVYDDLPEQMEVCQKLELPFMQAANYHNRHESAQWSPRGTLHEATRAAISKIGQWRSEHR